MDHYYLYNHINATYYDLGEGPWSFINDDKEIIFNDSKLFLEFLKIAWKSRLGLEMSGLEKRRDYKLIVQDILNFVKGIPKEEIECLKNRHSWAQYLKYKCAGTLHDLDSNYKPNNQEIKDMKHYGWSFRNLKKS